MENYLDFKGLLMTRVNNNSKGLDIPIADRLLEKSEYLQSELQNDFERTKSLRTHKDLKKMRIDLPKIVSRKELPFHLRRLESEKSKTVPSLDDP